jgi:hypothetical protein
MPGSIGLLWEDIDPGSDRGAGFERILRAILEVPDRPPLGPPPAFVRQSYDIATTPLPGRPESVNLGEATGTALLRRRPQQYQDIWARIAHYPALRLFHTAGIASVAASRETTLPNLIHVGWFATPGLKPASCGSIWTFVTCWTTASPR